MFTASNVSSPVPCRTVSEELLYMASNALAAGEPLGLRPPTEKSLMLFMAMAGSSPLKMRGTDGPIAIAWNGVFCPGCGKLCSDRLSQPSSVDFTPGVPDSIKSCASKCDRLGSGDPAACTI